MKSEQTSPPPTLAENLEQTERVLQELQNKGDKKQQEKIGRLLARTAPLKAYLSRNLEIEAASQALEPHRQEFDNFVNDNPAYQDRIELLFAEDRFAPLRFSPRDLQRAFDHAGSPLAVPKDNLAEHLRKLILYLADKEYRTSAAINLLISLPDYVSAARYMDGCLILSCARMTTEEPKSANPFLWQMFVHGYKAWAANKQACLGI
ncbi:MAG TPA: hypothetical protein VMR33_21650 [Candidatus Baltobacteraceae bacterium]|nr:hypothetical protein [Candidatus Baltobacteraceae bacterium]